MNVNLGTAKIEISKCQNLLVIDIDSKLTFESILSDRISLYVELLDKSNYVAIHQNNLQNLAMEMFKTHRG